MLERLKKSRKSSNFWSDIAFILSGMVLAGSEAFAQAYPERSIVVGILLTTINKGANIMHHIYSEK